MSLLGNQNTQSNNNFGGGLFGQNSNINNNKDDKNTFGNLFQNNNNQNQNEQKKDGNQANSLFSNNLFSNNNNINGPKNNNDNTSNNTFTNLFSQNITNTQNKSNNQAPASGNNLFGQNLNINDQKKNEGVSLFSNLSNNNNSLFGAPKEKNEKKENNQLFGNNLSNNEKSNNILFGTINQIEQSKDNNNLKENKDIPLFGVSANQPKKEGENQNQNNNNQNNNNQNNNNQNNNNQNNNNQNNNNQNNLNINKDYLLVGRLQEAPFQFTNIQELNDFEKNKILNSTCKEVLDDFSKMLYAQKEKFKKCVENSRNLENNFRRMKKGIDYLAQISAVNQNRGENMIQKIKGLNENSKNLLQVTSKIDKDVSNALESFKNKNFNYNYINDNNNLMFYEEFINLVNTCYKIENSITETENNISKREQEMQEKINKENQNKDFLIERPNQKYLSLNENELNIMFNDCYGGLMNLNEMQDKINNQYELLKQSLSNKNEYINKY